MAARYKLIIFIFSITLSCKNIQMQEEHNHLLTIEEIPVSVDEFLYSFRKSHQQQDTLTEEDVKNYLDLFTNYKLKVLEARRAGYDTSNTYLSELNKYQKELKDTYRTSDKAIDLLSREAYERLREEVHASHILIRVDQDAAPQDTLAAYKRVQEIRSELKQFPFDDLARKYSEDPSARMNGGDLGYFTAFKMVYEFEDAAYKTAVGNVSMPVRSQFGYHLIKVQDRRRIPYRMKLDHIAVAASSPQAQGELEQMTYEVHEMLKGGLSVEQVKESLESSRFSLTYRELPELSKSQIPETFHHAISQLKEEGQISDPALMQNAYHIFILKSLVELPDYEAMRPQLERMVRRSGRVQTLRERHLGELKRRYELNYIVDKQDIKQIDLTANREIFKLGGEVYTARQFNSFLLSSAPVNDTIQVYEEFVTKMVYENEDKEIISKNPELKWLLKEYEEGLLLFNIMEDSVWNRAAEDKTGLTAYTASNADDEKTEGQRIIEYQNYLEKSWIERLRARYDVKIYDGALKKTYDKILD